MGWIVEVKEPVLYPSLATEHPGVVLGRDQPLPSIEKELIQQGHTKDAVARNANLEPPLNAAGVTSALLVMHANADKLNDYENDDNKGIIAVGDVPPQPPYAPLFVNDTNDNEITGIDGAGSNNNSKSNINDS